MKDERRIVVLCVAGISLVSLGLSGALMLKGVANVGELTTLAATGVGGLVGYLQRRDTTVPIVNNVMPVSTEVGEIP